MLAVSLFFHFLVFYTENVPPLALVVETFYYTLFHAYIYTTIYIHICKYVYVYSITKSYISVFVCVCVNMWAV